MKESLIGSVVGTVTGAVETTTSALTGSTTSTKDTSSSKTSSSTASPSSSPSTSAPASTTSTPSITSTSAPAATTSVPASSTPVPASSTAAPSPATSSPAITAAGSTSDSSDSSSSVSSSGSSLLTPTETAAAPSISSASASAVDSSTTYSNSASLSASGLSGSSSAQSSGSKEQSQTNVSLGNFTGSSSQGGDEAGIGVTADTGISTGSMVVLVLAALGVLLLFVLLATWCLRRSRRHLMNSVSHVRLGATGDIPVFNTRGTERFETSSTSVSFGHFDTALDQDSMSEGPRRSGLWNDEVIAAMRVPMEKLTTTKLLSSGGYGEVYRGLYREQPVAIKVLLPEKRNLDQINAFLAEIKMMATIDHPCIVQFIAVAWDSPSDLSAVMEFMEGGDLRSLLDRFKQEQRPRGFDLDKARIALQTAQALTYLHSLDPKVLHRDLKTRNILLTSSMSAKLSDFGVARNYSFTSMTAAVGTSLWMAAEVMLGDRYDTSADIFSFGIVLSELDSHLHPYAEARMSNSGQRAPDAALLQLVAMGRVTISFSSNAPTELVDFGRACVKLDPSARPNASEVHYRLQLILQSYELYTV